MISRKLMGYNMTHPTRQSHAPALSPNTRATRIARGARVAIAFYMTYTTTTTVGKHTSEHTGLLGRSDTRDKGCGSNVMV